MDAERQADLYFVVELDGEKHKGYLKELKERVAAWAQGNGHTNGHAAQEAPLSRSKAVEEDAAPTRGGGLRPEPKGLSREELVQHRIDSAETTAEAMARWVAAYNEETVSLSMGKKTRHEYLLPQCGKLKPPLKETYDPTRDQYLWPNIYKAPEN